MEGKKALLKLQHEYQDEDWIDNYSVREATGGLFFVDPKEGKMRLFPGSEIDGNQLRLVKSEKGVPVRIEIVSLLGEPMEEHESVEAYQAYHGGNEEGEESKIEMTMLFSALTDPQCHILQAIDGQRKITPLSSADFKRSIEYVLEVLLDCEGISSAEFSGNRFIVEVDPRVTQNKILREIESWLGSCFNLQLVVLTPENYLDKFSCLPSHFQPPPNQLKLKFT